MHWKGIVVVFSDEFVEIMMLNLGMYLIIQLVLAYEMYAKRIHLVKSM